MVDYADSGPLGSGRLYFGLKYRDTEVHAQKTLYLNISLCQIISCRKYFVSLIFVGLHLYENILTTNVSRITVHY